MFRVARDGYNCWLKTRERTIRARIDTDTSIRVYIVADTDTQYEYFLRSCHNHLYY